MKKILSLFLAFVLMFGLSSSIVVQAKENDGQVVLQQDNFTVKELTNGVTEIKLAENGKVTTGYLYDGYVLINGEKHYLNAKEEVVYNKNITDIQANGLYIDDWQLIRTYDQTSEQYVNSIEDFKIVAYAVLFSTFGIPATIAVGFVEKYTTKFFRVGRMEYEFDLRRQVYGKTGQLNYCKRVDSYYGDYYIYVGGSTYEGYGLF